MNLGIVELVLILVILCGAIVLVVVPYWQIFRKAGFNPALSLLMVVPLANLVMLFYLAFAEWPILKQQQGKAGS
jgi:type VI protein secretion system component VasK